MQSSVSQLPWLPDVVPNFRDACKALVPGAENLGSTIQRLATSRLSAQQAGALGRAISRLNAGGADLTPLTPFRLAVLPSATFDMVGDALPAACARHGVALSLDVAPAEQVDQVALDPASGTLGGSPDAIYLAIDHRWFGVDHLRDGSLDDMVARLATIVASVQDRTGAPCIIPTIPVPPLPLFGSFDRRIGVSMVHRIGRLNGGIAELSETSGSILLDLATLADTIGRENWFDDRYHHLYKLPVAAAAVPIYADWIGRLIGAARGRARKCLILDLDNTCWGGVIGDDGLEGIQIGPGSPAGEAFAAVQQYALDLKARGIILAVSSKNNDETARQAFRDHPDMLLRESDIAVFQANWEDKPSNIEAIARTLSIGLDSVVLLDDNAAERAQVRAALPMVAVPELPSDAADYPATLAAAGYFEALSFSDEDRGRAATYEANAQRAVVMATSRDLGDYLRSLDMRIAFAPFDALNRARIAQLINKSNQFNLTTRRYTESDVAAFEADPETWTLQVRLSDRFSDFGMIGVIIASPAASLRSTWEIDTWLMSCRVLGRQVEQAMLAALAAAGASAGIDTLVGRYRPTPKNNMVADHYKKLGFVAMPQDGPDDLFALALGDFVAPALPFNQ